MVAIKFSDSNFYLLFKISDEPADSISWASGIPLGVSKLDLSVLV